MKNIGLKELVAAIVGSAALAYCIYDLVVSFQEQHLLVDDSESSKDSYLYGDLLEAVDDEDISKADLVVVLSTLVSQCAFTTVQNKIREMDYLPKISSFLTYPDKDVQTQTALLINNLSMNVPNQAVLKECIPVLIQLLNSNDVDESTVGLCTAILQALTNLTTLDSSHEKILAHIKVLSAFLDRCKPIQLKVQVLKIFVNISTNKNVCKNMLETDAQLLLTMEQFLEQQVEEPLVLRAVTCCANVLQALHCRWQNKNSSSNVDGLQIIPNHLKENLLKLSSHSNEDIRLQVSRSLLALPPATTLGK